MTNLDEPFDHEQATQERRGRVLGWVSGLALLIVPWIMAGILATAVTMGGPDSWDAESTFPWLLLAGFSGGISWIIYGSVRIRGFRHGAVPGAAVALTTTAGIYVLTLAIGK